MTNSQEKSIDWKELLKKYIEKVEFAEGIDFLFSSEWTKEEWAAFQEVVPYELKIESGDTEKIK